MKFILLGFILFSLFSNQQANAQISLKTEYIMPSSYKDENNNKVEGKGDLKVIQGSIRIPFSYKTDTSSRIKAWAIGMGGSYAAMKNRNKAEGLCPTGIINTQISIIHLRPIGTRWSMLAIAGVGLYSDNSSSISLKNIMAQGGIIFIRHFKSNIDAGAGIAINTTFGYPMAFPAFYFNWNTEGRFLFNVSLVDGLSASAGMRINKSLSLKIIAEMNGMMALVKKDGKDMIFTQQYTIVGLQPEFLIGKSISIPVTIGISSYRDAFYQERSLKAFFKTPEGDYDPHFSPAAYFSVGINYKF